MLKRFRTGDFSTRWMLICVAVATLLRLVLVYFHWPFTDSDEGNMGLLALHVAFQGDHPVFFYGAPYLGPLEGYAAVPLFRLFGSSLFALRLPLVIFFALFLISMYFLVRVLYKQAIFALAVVVLLGLGSPDVLFLQLRASGEYPEIEMFAALLCLLGVWLALTLPPPGQQLPRRAHVQRILLYGLLGMTAGLALWVDLLIIPFVLTVGLLLCVFNWRELVRLPGVSLLLGCGVGAWPLLYYNLTAPWSQNSWFVFLHLSDAAALQMRAAHLTWVHKLGGTLFVALPMATGGAWNCPLSALPPFGSPTLLTLPCVLLQGGWSLGYLALWLVAGSVAVYALWNFYRYPRALFAVPFALEGEERREVIRQCGRLVVLLSVGLTLALYITSPSPASYPDTSFRYLTCLLLALPVLLWPLWQGLTRGKKSVLWWWFQAALLFLVVVTLIGGMVRTLAQIPLAQARYQQQQTLVQQLLHVGAARLYSDYWTCNILIFLSQEKLICSALDIHMNPAQDRYLPYRILVHQTPYPAYIFVAGSPQERLMQQRALAAPAQYRIYRFEEYVVYLALPEGSGANSWR